MYPYIRLLKEVLKARRAPRLGILDTHISEHICWPWDIDPWLELNNGRTLTLFDLGRVPLGIRTGLDKAVMKNGWGMAIAGNSTRYRKRVTTFQRITMHSRCVGWDARFIYIDQSMWRGDDCTSQMLARSAFTSRQGIVAPERVIAAMGQDAQSPALPDWVVEWIAADAARPWPPEI
ncbi:acyl-CoA thioesterase [Gemmobacter serpentinus]|uniref:acyl-CoA thioesterase n=1 Tax=Gemmobacter serpentinus TaxID=2652247 RepID=UPI00124DC449|nr:acyl-CoA thioesterase [Gemmobacter serpentinus]